MVDQEDQRRHPGRAPSTSDLLAGRYVLEEKVAVGGMAAVWRAHDEVLARTVAVKILHDDLTRQPAVRERFRREAIAAAKLVHPNIVSLFDTGLDGEQVYLVIEYIEGDTLADVLEEGPMEVGEAARVAMHVAQALGHAHDRGIIHRDIKPANVLLASNRAVKVTDFGIAKAADDPTLTATGRVMGTAAYVAPEQLRGEQVTGAADLYSLGLVLFESLTGQRAFQGDDPIAVAEARLAAGPLQPRDLRADVPRALDDLVAELTAVDPAERLADPVTLVERLRPHAVSPLDGPAPLPAGVEEEPEDLREEIRWLWPVAGLMVLAAALVAVGIFGGVTETGDRVASLFAEEVTPTAAPPPEQDPDDEEDDAEASQPVPLIGLTAFDPQGDRGERDRFLENLTDGAPSTIWATERYNTASFGNLKDGVGFYGDLGGARTLTSVTLSVPTGGFDVEIRVAGRVSEELDAWPVVASAEEVAEGQVRLDLDDQPQARYLMVWVTGNLQPFEGQFRAEIGEVRVEALAS